MIIKYILRPVYKMSIQLRKSFSKSTEATEVAKQLSCGSVKIELLLHMVASLEVKKNQRLPTKLSCQLFRNLIIYERKIT